MSFIRLLIFVPVIACTFIVQTSAQDIFEAVENGNISYVKKILGEHPELVNSQNDNGNYPLHLAARNGIREIIELLIDNGADCNSKDNTGETPLPK
jgi:hypothetical protein